MLLNFFLFVRLSLVFRLAGEFGSDLGLEDGLGLGRLGLIASRSRELRVDKVIKEKFLKIVSVSLLDLVESLRERSDDLLAELIYFDLADPLEQGLLGLLNILSGNLDILA